MRRKFPPPYVLAMIVAFILFSSCAKDFMSNGSNHSSETDIGEAKTIFEQNATDLREVDFGLSMGRPSTKSNNKSVIIPKWEKPFVVSSGKFTIFEVPLGGDVKKHAFTTYRKDGIQKNPQVKKVTTKLILKRDNETGDYIYFIATLVGKNEDKNVKEINYTNNRSFTGYIFISNLEGLCVGVYKCNSGVRQRAEFAKSKTKAAANDGTIEGAIVQMFETPAEAYSYGESGGGSGGGIVMDRCSTCGYPKTNDLCLYCNPIITTPDYCNTCNGPYNNCYCCFICGDYPCTCYTPSYNCSYCGSYYCNGECRNTCYYCGSRYCSGGCQSTGGGGGGTTNPPTEPDESCSDEKCSTCGKCLNPSKSNCTKCICPKDCPDEKCQNPECGGCLAGIGGRPLVSTTRLAVNHKKCTCPVLCDDCGETQKDINGNSLCAIRNDTKYRIYSQYDLNGVSGYTKLWNDSKDNNIEMGGYITETGLIAINTNISENTTKHCHLGVVKGCKIANKYRLTLSDDSLKDTYAIVAPIHTHLNVNHYYYQKIGDNFGMYASNLLISVRDINLLKDLPTIEFGLIVSKGVVFKYLETARENNDFCKMYDVFY